MRLKILLQCVSKPQVIPINYNYQFSSAIYLLLKFGSPEFSKFLHDSGYELDHKKFKLFTFAVKLKKYEILDNYTFQGAHFKLISPFVELIISSPLIDSFIKNFVIGTFEKQKLFIIHPSYITRFIVKSVELVPNPQFTSEMHFHLLNPIVLSTLVPINGRLSPYYLRIGDKGLEENILQNLIRKYKIVYGKEFDIKNLKFEFEFDKEYIKKRKGVVSKLITIGEGSQYPIKIKGILCDFRIKTKPELIKVGYECGFGTKNSMGFGFVELRNQKNNLNKKKGELNENFQN